MTNLQPARQQLIDLLDAARDDWDRQAIERALWDAAHAGMPWPLVFRRATSLALDERAKPQAIVRQPANLPDQHAPARPEDARRYAARARAAIHHRPEET